jgi:tetratricopeptide (TPR) repeat protein
MLNPEENTSALEQEIIALTQEEPESTGLATRLNDLANAYQHLGRYSEAEDLYDRSRQIRETHLGLDHPDTGVTLHDLATLYDAMGNYEAAEPLYIRALKIRETHLGDHPDTATNLSNLAGLYKSTRQYDASEMLYLRSLKMREMLLGDHLSTATSLNNLAGLYLLMDNLSVAEDLFKRSLKMVEAQCGTYHPTTASSLNNLADLYHRIDNDHAAEQLLKRAIAICEELGTEHLISFSVLQHLVKLYISQGKYPKAGAVLSRWLVICQTQLPSDHFQTEQIQTALANLKKEGLYVPPASPQKPSSPKAFGNQSRNKSNRKK